ncbi:MAG: hypothetical protein ABIL01_12690 [Pseudomonadota bacterium]
MGDSIDELLKQGEPGTPCLGDVQRYRLQQLLRRHCGAVVWDGASLIEAPDMAVIVLNSATAPRVETLIRSLHENSIVVVPFGENPSFDFLKSKLHGYGSIGSQGTVAPHHIWWGGVKPPSVPTGLYTREDTLFVSLYQRGVISEEKAGKLAADLQKLRLDHIVEGSGSEILIHDSCLPKIDFIIRQWERSNRPIFWIDPDARVRRHPLLPQSLGCDFAVHKRLSGQMETGALFFHQTEPARALLDIWQRLSLYYPGVPEVFLLDQAWTLVSSQRQIETAWLPGTYWQAAELEPWNRTSIIQYDPLSAPPLPEEYFPQPFQRARQFGRHQAPEAHLIMPGPTQTRGPITVLIRDVLAGNAQSVSGAIEAAARAFATDPGGFSRLEVVLCAWDDDVDSVMQIEDNSWVLVTDPSERLQLDAFAKLDISDGSKAGSPSSPICSATTSQTSASIFRLADPPLGAKLKRSGKYQSLSKRPLALTNE